MSSSLKAILLKAKEKLDQQEYPDCLDHCQEALALNRKSYDAYL